MVVQVIPITIWFLPLHIVSSVTKLRSIFLSDGNKVQHKKYNFPGSDKTLKI